MCGVIDMRAVQSKSGMSLKNIAFLQPYMPFYFDRLLLMHSVYTRPYVSVYVSTAHLKETIELLMDNQRHCLF